jgi:hypothetical protein
MPKFALEQKFRREFAVSIQIECAGRLDTTRLVCGHDAPRTGRTRQLFVPGCGDVECCALEEPKEVLPFARAVYIHHRLGGTLERRQKRELEE